MSNITNKISNQLIAGVDEAGRGPLVGSVVAAAVILDPKNPIEGLADSKKLTQRKREKLAVEIKQKCLSYAIAEATESEIDEFNILNAALLAMQRATEKLEKQPDFVYVDGNQLPKWQYSSEAVIKGDSKIQEISAASILAKVHRDHMMFQLDEQYPQYGFKQHKGYPTKAHIEAIMTYGVLKEHRKSFKPIRDF
ncbi:ribonuclease HII [Thiotrichales bacterium 19S3-7]|nr:ribonuclease HII [Thiotrichales bacterium 19S3-7]MCF6801864.1 ribonuclease HII [Thiotrichales bacterium 19S3-11]